MSPKSTSAKNQPLTLCPAPDLDWSRLGTPASTRFDDIYFSVDDGLAETRAVYLGACGLPERWAAACDVFTVAELGFGTGLNFLATWKAWNAFAPRGAKRLHYVAVEKFPLDAAQLTQALSYWPDLAPLSVRLVAQWPGRVRGLHRLHFGDVTLTLIHDDVRALEAVPFSADAWYLDGFSPARNPDMWSEDVMTLVGACSAPGAGVGTFTAAGSVRTGLAKAGFEVRKVEGFGRKRHRLEAVMPGQKTADGPDMRPIIIGAGIGGASLAAAFLRRGITPTVIDADDRTAASGNAAAIIKPRLDRQDRADSRFFLSSFLYARQRYIEADAVITHGVFHAAKTDEDRLRMRSLADQSPLPTGDMIYTQNAMGLGGLHFQTAMTIDPARVRNAMLNGATRMTAQVSKVDTDADGVVVYDAAGQVMARGSHAIFAVGAGVRDLARFDPLGLRFSRGQLSWGVTALKGTLTYGGYAIAVDGDTLLGATHGRFDADAPRAEIYAPSPEDDASNLSGFTEITGVGAQLSQRPSRVSVRVNTPQTWPARIDFGDGISALTGLGSRGFVFAPLLGEAVVSDILGEVPAIESGLFLRTV